MEFICEPLSCPLLIFNHVQIFMRIDTEGRIRRQDISYEPFMDPDFVLKEANRLLGQDKWKSETKTPALTAAAQE